jgi:hypothetical protein
MFLRCQHCPWRRGDKTCSAAHVPDRDRRLVPNPNLNRVVFSEPNCGHWITDARTDPHRKSKADTANP